MTEIDSKLKRVLEDYGPMLFRLATSYEWDPALRDDLLQDIAFSIWKALPTFKNEASLKTFIARVAHNRAVDHVIKRQRIADRQGSVENAVALTSKNNRHPHDRIDLLKAIRRLSLPNRQCVELMLEGFTHSEIGESLVLEENTVAQRLSRGRRQLRAILNPGEPE